VRAERLRHRHGEVADAASRGDVNGCRGDPEEHLVVSGCRLLDVVGGQHRRRPLRWAIIFAVEPGSAESTMAR
jgi:hypothetical protein